MIEKFLFQIGTIKTAASVAVTVVIAMFLFQIGTIKTIVIHNMEVITNGVSIPNWYD